MEIYPKMVKHSNGYLVWGRFVREGDIWAKRELATDGAGWYVNISRDGEQFGTFGPFAGLQDAMQHGMSEADGLDELDPLP